MSNKKRVCVAVTARPSYSRIRTALQALQASPHVELQVVCSGSALLQRYGRVVDLIRADGFEVADELYSFVEGDEPINMAFTTANTIQHSATFLRRLAPDWVVTIADRYETLGTATAAAYLGLPLIHVQGGEVTGNIDEKVRHAVTKLADIHLVSNEQARSRIVRMGEHPGSIFVTGCPSIDIARETLDMPLSSVQRSIDELGVGARIDLNAPFLVVLQHPETDAYHHSYARMEATLQAVRRTGLPTIVFWPNVDAGSDATSKAIRVFRETAGVDNVRYMKNLEGHEFLRLLNQSCCLVGNSSVGVRECSFMGTPVVNLGDRQHGRERAPNVRDCGWQVDAIYDAIQEQLRAGRFPSSGLYGQGYAGVEIARVIERLDPVAQKRFYE